MYQILLIARGNIRKNKTTKDPSNIFAHLRIMKLFTFEKYGRGKTRTTTILVKTFGKSLQTYLEILSYTKIVILTQKYLQCQKHMNSKANHGRTQCLNQNCSFRHPSNDPHMVKPSPTHPQVCLQSRESRLLL